MPNHVSNKLTIEGTPEKRKEIIAFVAGEEGCIDFNKIVPMPPILKYTGKGSSTIDGKKVTSWWQDTDHEYNDPDRLPDRLLTDEEQAQIKATGYSDWYDWSRDNWGTKWNAYGQRLEGDAVSFETAWSAPEPVIRMLSAQFPEARLILEYADEDIGRNAGKLVFRAGELIGKAECEGTVAAELYFRLNPASDPKDWGYDPLTFERIGEEEEAA